MMRFDNSDPRVMAGEPTSAEPAPLSSSPMDAVEERKIRKSLVELLPNLRAFARSLCGNPTRADDLVQECIVKALSNLQKYKPGTNLRAWLFVILRNTYYSELRKQWREVDDKEGEHAAKLVDMPQQDAGFELEDFKNAFVQLSEEHREVLSLVAAMGLPYEEAAEICGCAVGTIKSRVNRARRRLAELLGVEPGDHLGDDSVKNIPHGVIISQW